MAIDVEFVGGPWDGNIRQFEHFMTLIKCAIPPKIEFLDPSEELADTVPVFQYKLYTYHPTTRKWHWSEELHESSHYPD